MSDFFQHGLISTLHQLNEQPHPLELSSGRGKLGLILPCHYRDLASAALTSIIEVLNSSGLFDLVIVTMNGIGETQLRTPHRVLWSDHPQVLNWLSRKGLVKAPGILE